MDEITDRLFIYKNKSFLYNIIIKEVLSSLRELYYYSLYI